VRRREGGQGEPDRGRGGGGRARRGRGEGEPDQRHGHSGRARPDRGQAGGRARRERGEAGRQRRRGEALESSILEAAWEELAEVGYARLTMEGVAARARTGKQVLYRRWPNRAELVVAAMRHNTGSIVDDVPDTGELRADVLEVLGRMARRQREIGPDVIHGLLIEADEIDPHFFTVMGEVMATILRRAAERGEIAAEPLPRRVVTMPSDLLRYELLLARDPVPDRTLVEIVDQVFLPLVRAIRAPDGAGERAR
jgi:AcrR family transcriptional regulator